MSYFKHGWTKQEYLEFKTWYESKFKGIVREYHPHSCWRYGKLIHQWQQEKNKLETSSKKTSTDN